MDYIQANKQKNNQTNNQASKQTSKQANEQASKQTNKQRHTNIQTYIRRYWTTYIYPYLPNLTYIYKILPVPPYGNLKQSRGTKNWFNMQYQHTDREESCTSCTWPAFLGSGGMVQEPCLLCQSGGESKLWDLHGHCDLCQPGVAGHRFALTTHHSLVRVFPKNLGDWCLSSVLWLDVNGSQT